MKDETNNELEVIAIYHKDPKASRIPVTRPINIRQSDLVQRFPFKDNTAVKIICARENKGNQDSRSYSKHITVYVRQSDSTKRAKQFDPVSVQYSISRS